MAAAGGGKIRTRRYHIASKPYVKGKQQQGIISRVTDTVKSIVPGWLQKYFKNGEPAETGEVMGVAVEQDTHLNNQAPNDEDISHAEHDGTNSPEPTTSNAEPSTSRSSLNFQDMLSRPPLNRSHLNFSTLDASVLHSHPSTSTAFPIGGSGFSLVKEIKDSTSQHEDDNISTTSGFSSRASDKDVTTSKNTSLPPLWSPELDRSHSVPQQAGAGLKKPAFNLSVFGSSNASLATNLTLNSSQLGDSPFYPGKTTYGGAAAVKASSRARGTPYQAPVRRHVKAKPAASPCCGVTSATARRILQSLERMSSPLADAKRIPSTASSPLSTFLDRSDADVTNFQPKRKKVDSAYPPVQKLMTPVAASIASNRSMSFKPSLTPTGSLSRTNKRRESYDRAGRQSKRDSEIAEDPPRSTSFSYPLFSTPASNGMGSGGAGGKMKRERGIRASSKVAPEDEMVDVPQLPIITLPISSSTLPTFSFTSSPAASRSPTTRNKPITTKVPPVASSSPSCTAFTFSSPIVKATEPNLLPLSPSAGFTFSVPVAKAGPSDSGGKASATSAQTTSTSCLAAGTPANDEMFEGPFKPAKSLKEGSVLDILKGPGFSSFIPTSRSTPIPQSRTGSANSLAAGAGFGDQLKPAAGSWQCDACLLQNKATSESKCLACGAAKPNKDSYHGNSRTSTTEPLPSFVYKFKPVAGSWECDTCLVQNKPEAVKCVACETPKPGTGVKSALTSPVFSLTLASLGSTSSTSVTGSTPSLLSVGFGGKFKKPEGAWECDVCLLENKADDSKCVACQSAKPGATAVTSVDTTGPAPSGMLGFGDQFKKPEGSWECDVCCVQNKAEATQCVACLTDKPGAKVEPKGFGGSSFSSSTAVSPFTFGIQSSATDTTTVSSGGFKFGDQGGIKFGTADSSIPASNTSTGGFGAGFKFGTSSSVTTESDDGKKPDAQGFGSSFKFGIASGIAFGIGNSTSNHTENKSESTSKPSLEGFSFGLASPAKVEEKGAQGGFAFTAPKEKLELGGTKAATGFSFGKGEEKKDSIEQTSTPAFTFGKPVEKDLVAPVPITQASASASAPVLVPASAMGPTFSFGKLEEKTDSLKNPSGFLFNTAKEADKPAPSLGFSFGKPEPPKEETMFGFGKPAEKEDATEPSKPAFPFGSGTTDPGAPKPGFSFLTGGSSTTAPAATTAAPSTAPSLFGTSSSSAPSNPAGGPSFIFGQASATESTPAKAFVFGSQEKPSVPSTAAPVQPFMFGSGSNSTPGFNFGAAAPSTASSTGSSGTPFVFGSAPSSTTASAPAFGASQAPAFGQGSGQPSAPAFGPGSSQPSAPAFGTGSSQPSAPAFGSAVPSLFSAGAQPPSFGSQANSTQAPAFGQQNNPQAAFGSSAASSAPGGGFQFVGTSAFGASGSGGVFAFGAAAGGSAAPTASPAVPIQAPGPTGGFNFAQPPTFNIGSTKSPFPAPTPGQHNISGRKIKTAVRRRK
ncbi:nuclear pore complex protein Nup153 [Amia ocellicauda]|uniref:nuclear pore complex protein Nup153 n=1 Tax=Amia ocellicauda TaxID=2972642 RepID=UPI003464A3D6